MIGNYQTLTMHWDGTQWSVVPSLNPSPDRNVLTGVSAASADDVWAVGVYNTATVDDQTLTMHWNGVAWSIVPSPNPGAFSYLNAVAAVAPNDVWAVGGYVNAGAPERALVEHWDGVAWTVVPTPESVSGHFNSIAAVSPSDIWAVGAFFDETANTVRTFIEHWDGNNWSVVSSPNLGMGANFLYSVSVISASDIWAVGEYNNAGVYQTLTMHWDGDTWSIVASPNDEKSSNLYAVAAASSGEVFAAGRRSNPTTGDFTFIQHYGDIACVVPTSVTSSKTHGSATVFEIDLPLTGAPGVECRSGRASKAHQVVFKFGTAVTFSDASVTPATGHTAETDGSPVRSADGKEVTLNLRNVSNAQAITVKLLGVGDGTNTNDVSIQMGVLLGDTTGDGVVNSGDISQTRRQSGRATTESTKRIDLSADGVIDSGDITLVRRQSGTALP